MAQAPRQTLSHADNAWLQLEQPDNLMTIAGVMTCRQPVDFLELKELIEDKLMRHERFRQQVIQREAGDDEAMLFDEDYIRALEYGLPPTVGEGLGIDRLVKVKPP